MTDHRSAACDCHLHEHQVCDVCQGVDPDNPAPDVEPDAASGQQQRAERLLSFAAEMRQLADRPTLDPEARRRWMRETRGKIKGFVGDAEVLAREVLRGS